MLDRIIDNVLHLLLLLLLENFLFWGHWNRESLAMQCPLTIFTAQIREKPRHSHVLFSSLFFSLLAKRSSFMSSYLPMCRRSACQIRSFFPSFIIKCYRSTERFHRKSNFKKLFKLFRNEMKKIIHSRCFLSLYLIIEREHWKKRNM